MIKKIILEFILVLITVLIVICGYFLIIDIESKIPDNLYNEVSVETREFMERKVFILSPRDEEKSDKVILYFHGGAYVAEATDKHWEFLKKIVNDTKATVIMPDYPLTPKYTYKDVMNMVEPLYKETVSRVDNEKLILMGDSAGGGLALGLAEKMSANNVKLPSKIILISPWLDVTMSNEKIDEVQKNDKELSKERLAIAGIAYARDLKEEEDYFVNPVNGDISKLKNIIIYTGNYDILNPDCYTLREKIQPLVQNVNIKEYDTAPHIWIINNDDELAQKAYNDLIEDVKN